ncbi:Sulfatase-modifying factor enzyme 1 [Thermoflexibacter ruber]|uniref:Sulfatase-modifying factor enzyme 1 n=1 Tax=Thermoflexibacter ruber TaxID=1003 RepID=A0A1I2FFU8_9BACT|nr:Sulfatase-modifying factor enzyme 1 [Thermoflexibacter ruber]
MRLPTEAEWEYTAKGGIYWKDNYKYAGCNTEKELDDFAWFFDNVCTPEALNSRSFGTKPVGTKKHNQLGIYDLSGNVWEWCEDAYDKDFYEKTRGAKNPVNKNIGSYRVLRGGSWFYYPVNCRVAFRFFNTPSNRNRSLGFRLVISF